MAWSRGARDAEIVQATLLAPGPARRVVTVSPRPTVVRIRGVARVGRVVRCVSSGPWIPGRARWTRLFPEGFGDMIPTGARSYRIRPVDVGDTLVCELPRSRVPGSQRARSPQRTVAEAAP